MKTISSGMNYFLLARPKQWIKNFLIFAPLFFSRQFGDTHKVFLAAIALIAFSFVASGIYVLNDIIDREADKNHSYKKNRPIAAGVISVPSALIFSCLLFAIAAFLLLHYVPVILPLVFIWFLLNLSYSLYLKHIPVFDILLISFFYFVRVQIGALIATVQLSNWLTLCVIFFSLFIIIAKRKAELTQENKRKVLNEYDANYLDHLLTISAGVTLVTYGIYTVLGPVPPLAVYSIFFVMLGLFRYLHIVYTTAKAESPEDMIIDGVILGSFIAWICYMFYIFYIL
jgi:4-hydroxybenzoate polyprenyltransferase